MALAYTAPTWQNGGGVGISASQLQALSDCMEGLVQGSDKAITNISISGQIITLTFADGSQEAGTASGLKGISSIAKTGTSGLVDTYTITYTDGSTATFTVTNGADGNFYIVTAGIKSTDDPYGNIEYYIGGDFYKNGVLYNQSAFYKVTLVDETEYPPSPYLIDGSSGIFTNGHYSTGSIGGIPSGTTITTQIFTDSTMTTLLGEVKVLIGLRGSEGEQGPQGPAGDDGVSPEVTITPITGGHRVNITDADHPSGQNFDVMDGATQDISGKADKVSNATNGDFAGLDANGNLTDSGKSSSDFLPSDTPIPSITNCYQSTDTAETALADDDYFPFYDTSATAKRKTLWSNIKSVLKSYFDTLYTKTVANPTGTATGTLTKLGIGSDIYDIQGGGGASALADLTDVNISNPTDGQILQYDATSQKWVNGENVPLPVGSIVTPTDDIQTWLHCAGIYNKNYTLLSEVLADSTVLLGLMSSNNASDYMVRSTTWASAVTANSTAMSYIGANDYCSDELLDDSTWRTAICDSTHFESVLNVKVPTMTSNTQPSGEASSNDACYNSYYPWKAFNNDPTISSMENRWQAADSTNHAWLQYKFVSAVKIYKVGIAAGSGRKIIVKASNDGTNFTDLTDELTIAQDRTAYYFNVTKNFNTYQYYRFYFVTTNTANSPFANFYGRA